MRERWEQTNLKEKERKNKNDSCYFLLLFVFFFLIKWHYLPRLPFIIIQALKKLILLYRYEDFRKTAFLYESKINYNFNRKCISSSTKEILYLHMRI